MHAQQFHSENMVFSPIALGFWRLADWNMSAAELESYVSLAIELGITTMDHADIYGEYACEALFGEILKKNPLLRNRMQLVTKCGIKLVSGKFPNRKIKTYDTSYRHIVSSAEQSLRNFNTDHIDLLLIHRPDPLMDPYEISRAFDDLYRSGKVLHFGVSNFTPLQFEVLNNALDRKLVTNQLQISPNHLEHFDNGNIDFLTGKKIHPMAWSPLGFGKLFNPVDEKNRRINNVLRQLSDEVDAPMDQLIFAWILHHPAGIIPIAGTGKPERLQSLVKSADVKLSTEQWYRIYNASKGEDLP